MNLLSIAFVLFFLAAAAVYFLFPVKKYQWTVLLAASYAFYAFAGPKYLGYMAFTTLSSYLLTLWMGRVQSRAKQTLAENKESWDKERKKRFKAQVALRTRWLMLTALLLNFGVLFVLKYLPTTLAAASGIFGFTTPGWRLVLPLGISFYTFQTMGYVIDVYRGEVAVEKNLGKLALFVSFFPQLLQGPISRYDQLASQLYEPHRFEFKRLQYGLELILWGLFKKLVIANRAAIAIQTVTAAPDSFAGGTLAFTVVLYALQVYADFSAGIDIARAVAQILGIDMIQNFRQPYFARSLTEYWNRWHISLGAWMKTYVFYPIALSKRANRFTRAVKASRFGNTKVGAHIAVVLPGTLASLIVFLLVGIWHGAGWRYIIYGLWNGGVIMTSILLKPCFEALNRLLHIDTTKPEHYLFQILRTFLLVCVGNLTDLVQSGREFFHWLRRIFTETQFFTSVAEVSKKIGLGQREYFLLLVCTLLLYFVGVIRERHPQTPLRELMDRRPYLTRFFVIVGGVAFLLIFGVYGPGVGANEFAYMEF